MDAPGSESSSSAIGHYLSRQSLGHPLFASPWHSELHTVTTRFNLAERDDSCSYRRHGMSTVLNSVIAGDSEVHAIIKTFSDLRKTIFKTIFKSSTIISLPLELKFQWQTHENIDGLGVASGLEQKKVVARRKAVGWFNSTGCHGHRLSPSTLFSRTTLNTTTLSQFLPVPS